MPTGRTRVTAAITVIVLLLVGIYVYSTQTAPSADEVGDEITANISTALTDAEIQAGRGAYKIQDIGAIGSTDPSIVSGYILDMNSNGTIIGSKSDPKNSYRTMPFIRRVDKPLTLLPSSIEIASRINDNGIITGYDQLFRPIIYTVKTKKVTTVSNLPGRWGGLSAINKQNLIAGQASTSQPNGTTTYNTFTLKMDKQPEVIPGLGIRVTDMNNKGEIIGIKPEPYSNVGYIYSKASGKQALGKGYPEAINNNGTVVGVDQLGNPYRLKGAGGAKSLGTLGSTTQGSGWTNDVNDKEQIVGVSEGKAFIYTDGTGMRDLNTLLPTGSTANLTNAVSINNQGMIAAVGTKSDGTHHGYLLIPKNRR